MTSNREFFGDTDLQPLNKVDYRDVETNYEKWCKFHEANPHVYEYLRNMALHLKRRGFKKCGIALLWERLRWLSYVQTFGVDEYKLGNTHRAYYARFLMETEPELVDFFDTRFQPAEDHPFALYEFIKEKRNV